MQCACTILSAVACPALQYFSTLSHKRHDFRKKKKVIEYKTRVSSFSTTCFETFFIIIKTERDMIKNVYWSSCPILKKLEFSPTDFRKKSQISNFVKIRRVGGELFHADRRTDKHDEASSRFPHFASRLKMIVLVSTFVHDVISIFQRDVVENCTLLGYYAASSDNSLPMFRDNLSIPS